VPGLALDSRLPHLGAIGKVTVASRADEVVWPDRDSSDFVTSCLTD